MRAMLVYVNLQVADWEVRPVVAVANALATGNALSRYNLSEGVTVAW